MGEDVDRLATCIGRDNGIGVDPRWRAVMLRESEADERFFYSVRTTGVYCRPSCPSRRPRPENVSFHETREEAERLGFRPCRRCRPDRPTLASQHAKKVAEACRVIEGAEEKVDLKTLALRVGMSAWHFHRVFKLITGITPKEYEMAYRSKRVRRELNGDGTITEAILESGFNSSSRFYEKSDEVLGMTPREYRRGGGKSVIRFALGECSLGSILVAQTERGICAILLGDDPEELLRDLEDCFPRAQLIGGDSEFEKTVAMVVGLVESPGRDAGLPLDIGGTAFQRRVWRALQAIPVGTTASYAEIAERIGSPQSMRAVAQACAANAIAIAIPCHRVVRSDGGLSGYRWGVERKRTLLDREAQVK
jgi:AraC family transcriptional regulator, regulatory protein of adaptative response / methylated-DNA-[protein]-cysteine methyltransferase